MSQKPTRNHWMLVCTVDNFELSRGRGFDVVGMKSRHRKKAEQVKPGDKVIFYLAKEMAIGGVVEVTSTFREERFTIWQCPERQQEVFPFRFDTRPEIACKEYDYVPVIDLLLSLQHVKRWPPEHWRLAFQGNVHNLEARDYETIKKAIKERVERPDNRRSSLRARRSSARITRRNSRSRSRSTRKRTTARRR